MRGLVAAVCLMVLVVGIHSAAISSKEIENLAKQLLHAVSVNKASQKVAGIVERLIYILVWAIPRISVMK